LIFVLKIICWLLFLPILFVIIVFLTRSYFSLQAALSERKTEWSARVGHFSGLLAIRAVWDESGDRHRLRIYISGMKIFDRPIGAGEKKAAEKKKPRKAGKRPGLSTLRAWISLGKEVLRRLLGIVRIEKLKADLRVGTGNPAYTGILMGAVAGLRYSFPILRDISIQPVFLNKEFTGNIAFDGSIRLIHIVPVLIFGYRQYIRKIKHQRGA